ncbi:uncharacterized protein EV420DRAFT_1485437 [Desarmillaria tabescens]|uniref:Uncharacterized protein n=1 Tax=Armillaria tabescens TaxID=1929756 RepID=A0AA39JFU9_ARMTA|nr:uncharacterized protein EV420DRAFT_1485437 [Desarmillaria tabescens]KAK0441997.1 hypothetical protein EV420DRAFT_1485437 [Desarmillaria tabescens]
MSIEGCPDQCQALALPDDGGLEALGLMLSDYENAFVHPAEGANVVGCHDSSDSSTSSSSTVTSTKPPKAQKRTFIKATKAAKAAERHGRPSSLPTLSQLLASKSTTVFKTRIPTPALQMVVTPTLPLMDPQNPEAQQGNVSSSQPQIIPSDGSNYMPPSASHPLLPTPSCPALPAPSRPALPAPSAPSCAATPPAALKLPFPPPPPISPPPLLPSPFTAPASLKPSTLPAQSPILQSVRPVPSDNASAAKDAEVGVGSTVALIHRSDPIPHDAPFTSTQRLPGFQTGQLSLSKRTAEDSLGSSVILKRMKMDGRGGGNHKGSLTTKVVEAPGGTEKVVPPLISIVFPSSAPLWVVMVLELFTSHDFRPDWTQVVYSWVAFQSANGFDSSDKLPTNYRPNYANLDLIQKFQLPFWAWWANLQPEGHVGAYEHPIEDLEREDDRRPIQIHPLTDISWECLKTCSGRNGMVSVVAALFFWAEGAKVLPLTTHSCTTICEQSRLTSAGPVMMMMMVWDGCIKVGRASGVEKGEGCWAGGFTTGWTPMFDDDDGTQSMEYCGDSNMSFPYTLPPSPPHKLTQHPAPQAAPPANYGASHWHMNHLLLQQGRQWWYCCHVHHCCQMRPTPLPALIPVGLPHIPRQPLHYPTLIPEWWK